MIGMSSKEYWREREEKQRKHYITEETEYQRHISDIYNYMMDQIQKEINGFYVKYAKKEGITLSEAKKRVAKLDIEEYGRKAAKYVKEKDFSKEANDEMRLYNATMKINRLEMLKANIGLELVDGFDELQKYYEQILTDRALAEFERQAGILGDTVLDNAQAAHAVVNASFHNAKYSDRVWMYQDMLKAELDKLLRQGLIQGKHPRELSRHLVKLFGVSRSNAERLMRTELARVQIEAQKKSFERNGYEEYEFIALGISACEKCRNLDGKHFKVKDMMPTENAPPMHPNCRCSTAAWVDGEEYDKWLNEKEGMKLSDTTDKWAKEARKELLKAEKSIKDRKRETLEVYSALGKYIMTKRGDSLNVSMSPLDYYKLVDAVVTHNHPSGGSFSFTDIKFLKWMPISELRVAVTDGVYYMRKPSKWPREIKSAKDMGNAYEQIRNDLKHKYEEMYNSGKITKAERHKMFSHEVNKIFAERFGLEYGFETYG